MTKFHARVMTDDEGEYVILPDELVASLRLEAGTSVQLRKHDDVIFLTRADEEEEQAISE